MHAISKPDALEPMLETEQSAPVDDGETAALHAQRAIAELRAGREVEVRAGTERLVVVALELLDPVALDRAAAGSIGLELLLTSERASVLGHDGHARAVLARLPAGDTSFAEADSPARIARRIAGLFDPAASFQDTCSFQDQPHITSIAALELIRQARLQPALLVKRGSPSGLSRRQGKIARVVVQASDLLAYREARGRLIARSGSARVQLERASDSTFIAYRERFGDAEHAAVIIGSPDLSRPVTVRLHSSCFTGDLFGSLRCDCGEQLDGAIDRLAADGGGVVLYLAQEGRGIGLGNKLRAYRMQAAGLDTIEADRRLGFAADGRDFGAARAMLRDLGIHRVRLLTNNPAKVVALHGDGLEVVERLPLSGTMNPYNHRYLETKRDRGGHLPSVTAGAHRHFASGDSSTT